METKYWRYIRLSGKVKSPRKQGPPCSHPRKCFEQVSSDEREHLLMQFNYMGQYDLHRVTCVVINSNSNLLQPQKEELNTQLAFLMMKTSAKIAL